MAQPRFQQLLECSSSIAGEMASCWVVKRPPLWGSPWPPRGEFPDLSGRGGTRHSLLLGLLLLPWDGTGDRRGVAGIPTKVSCGDAGELIHTASVWAAGGG